MLILKLGEVVDILVDDNVQIIRLIMRRNILCCKSLRHLCSSCLIVYNAMQSMRPICNPEKKSCGGRVCRRKREEDLKKKVPSHAHDSIFHFHMQPTLRIPASKIPGF